MTYFSTSLQANPDAGLFDLTTTDLGYMFRIVKGGPNAENWETRGVDITIPGMDGQLAYPRARDRLLIIAAGMIHGAGSTDAAQRADFAAKQRALRVLMNPEQDPYELLHTDEAGTVWSIFARPLPSNPEWADDDIPSRRDGVLSWVAIGEDWAEAAGS